MLSERLKTTLEESQAELNTIKVTLADKKAKLKATLSTELTALNDQYRKEARHLRALVRALEAQAVEAKPDNAKEPEEPAS